MHASRTLLLVTLLHGCGSDAPAGVADASVGSNDAAAPVATQIGPTGGTVAGPNGVNLVIPAGALAAPTTIAIAPASGVMPQGYSLHSPVYEFGPAGTTFALPVQVSIPFTPGSMNPVLYWSNATGFEDANGTVQGNTMVAYVTHFSQGFVGRLPVAAMPTQVSFTFTVNGHAAPNITMADCQKMFDVGIRDLNVKIVMYQNPFQRPYYEGGGSCDSGMAMMIASVRGEYVVDVALVTADLRYVSRHNSTVFIEADGVPVNIPLIEFTNP